MDYFTKMDFFFIIASVGFVLMTIAIITLSIVLYKLISKIREIADDIKEISGNAKEISDEIQSDVSKAKFAIWELFKFFSQKNKKVSRKK